MFRKRSCIMVMDGWYNEAGVTVNEEWSDAGGDPSAEEMYETECALSRVWTGDNILTLDDYDNMEMFND